MSSLRAFTLFLILAASCSPVFALEGPRFADLPKDLAIVRSEGNGQKRRYAINSLDKAGTKAANIEGRTVITFPNFAQRIELELLTVLLSER